MKVHKEKDDEHGGLLMARATRSSAKPTKSDGKSSATSSNGAPGNGWRNRIIGEGEEAPDQLLANPRNYRIHSLAQQKALEGALSEIGWVQRIIINQRTGYVIDGHARIALAISKGEKSVPVVYVDLDENEEGIVLASLDPLAAMAGTDQAKLDELLAEITVSDEALRDMLKEPEGGLTGDDAIPEDVEPTTKPGDLWLLGDHRLRCGDATKVEDVERLMDGATPFLCVTDPPYGVEYDADWRNQAAASGDTVLGAAKRRVGEVTNDDRADWREAWELFPGDVIYSWHPSGAPSLIHAAALQETGFALRMQIIWAKSNFPIGRGDYHVRHEPCWYAVREGQPAQRNDDRTQTTLWEISLDKNVEGGHSTQKPLECMARPIRNHDAPEVYDPFLGSGTTLIACEKLGRRAYCMEIEPKYCDVAVKRWEEYTGQEATLEATGKSFDYVSKHGRSKPRKKGKRRRSSGRTKRR